MSEGHLLIVSTDVALSQQLHEYFAAVYDVQIAVNDEQALNAISEQMPDVIILDSPSTEEAVYNLKDKLRAKSVKSPIIIMYEKVERSNVIEDFIYPEPDYDYLTKPFDIEELNLRVQNAVKAFRKGRR